MPQGVLPPLPLPTGAAPLPPLPGVLPLPAPLPAAPLPPLPVANPIPAPLPRHHSLSPIHLLLMQIHLRVMSMDQCGQSVPTNLSNRFMGISIA